MTNFDVTFRVTSKQLASFMEVGKNFGDLVTVMESAKRFQAQPEKKERARRPDLSLVKPVRAKRQRTWLASETKSGVVALQRTIPGKLYHRDDIAQIMVDHGWQPTSGTSVLHRLAQEGWFIKVERGLYQRAELTAPLMAKSYVDGKIVEQRVA